MTYRLILLTTTLVAAVIGLAVPSAASGHCTISISPGSGAAVGETITISGAGWDANDIVYINLSGVQIVNDATADGDGNFSTNATVPDLNNGDHLVFASNNAASCEVNSSYPVVDPAPPLVCIIAGSPSGGAPVGGTIDLTGNGWATNDTVHVNLGGIQLGTFSADASGNLSASATVPQLDIGDHQLFAFNDSATCEDSSTFAVTNVATTAPPVTATPATTTTEAPATTTTTSGTTVGTNDDERVATTSSSTTAAAANSSTTTTTQSQALETNSASSSSGISTGVLILAILALLAAAGLVGNVFWSRRKSTDS